MAGWGVTGSTLLASAEKDAEVVASELLDIRSEEEKRGEFFIIKDFIEEFRNHDLELLPLML